MNCCDDFGNCRQGRDCPVRTQREATPMTWRQAIETAAWLAGYLLLLVFMMGSAGYVALWVAQQISERA